MYVVVVVVVLVVVTFFLRQRFDKFQGGLIKTSDTSGGVIYCAIPFPTRKYLTKKERAEIKGSQIVAAGEPY